jgi:hypothetical protein
LEPGVSETDTRLVRDIAREKARVAKEKAKVITPRIHHELHRDAVDFMRFYVVEFIILVLFNVQPANVVHHAAIFVWRIVP